MHLISIALFLPLLGFLFLLFGNKFISKRFSGYVGCATVFLSFLCFVKLLYGYYHSPLSQEVTLFSWIQIQGFDANFSLYVDHLSLLMGLVVTGVGFLIHVFSVGYMDHDEHVVRFFTLLNFF